MGDMTGKSPAATYKDLLRLGTSSDNAGATTTLVAVEDGAGNDTPLKLATDKVTVNDNYPLEGYTTGRAVLRVVAFSLAPGATANTNINVTTGGTTQFNAPTISDATNLAKDGTSGSFSLNTAGNILECNLTENVIGGLSANFTNHDLNSSSTSEMYLPVLSIDSGNLRLLVRKRGSTSTVDWTSILDAGDSATIVVAFLTSS